MAAIDALFPPGSKWLVQDTERNARNGLVPLSGAWLTFLDATHFSIVVMQPGQPHLRIERALFGNSFTRSLDGLVYCGHVGTSHAKRDYL